MSQISHPCLVKLLGANLGTNPFVLTEFMEHRDVEMLRPQIFHEDADDFSWRYAEICLGTDCTIKVANAGFVLFDSTFLE